MPDPLYSDFRPDREPFTGLNRLASSVEALRNATGAGGLGVSNEAGGLTIRDERPLPFMAKTVGTPLQTTDPTGATTYAHGWVRLVSATGNSNLTDGFGSSGTTTVLPAYAVDNKSYPDGTVVLMWVADSNDEMRFIAPPAAAPATTFAGVRVRNSVNQTISVGTITALTFDTEDIDTNAFHDLVTNPGRLTVPTGQGGTYMIGASAAWVNDGISGQREINLVVNGATTIGQHTINSASNVVSQCATIYALADGDYVETTVWFNTTQPTQDIAGIDSFTPVFWMYRLG